VAIEAESLFSLNVTITSSSTTIQGWTYDHP